MKLFTNDFKGKKLLVSFLADIYKRIEYSDIKDIELKKYVNDINQHEEEFIVLTWTNGAISTANNNINSINATARNVANMLDGGVYQNLDRYIAIMNSDEWVEVEWSEEEL